MTHKWPQDGLRDRQNCRRRAYFADLPSICSYCLRWPQGGPKIAPRWPKMVPRWPQNGPRWPTNRCKAILRLLRAGFKMQDSFKMTPRWPEMAQDGPKKASRWPKHDLKMASGIANFVLSPRRRAYFADLPFLYSYCLRWPQNGPRWPRDGPKMAQDGQQIAATWLKIASR